ncbi:MAG: hypothetical protein WHV67_06295, partial [Thermoanaerobaculia bacterium]
MKKILFPFLFFLIITLLLVHSPVFFSFFKEMQTDPGDTRFNNYILEHIHQYLSGNLKSFSSPQFYYPHKNNLYFSDPWIFFYPFYGIFRFFGFEYDTSFQLFMILSTILNFCLSFYLFHIIDEKKPFFNGFGSTFFSASNIRVCQVGHQQLIPNFYIILCFIFLFLIYKNYKENPKKTKLYILFFSFSSAFQALSAFYNFFSFLLYTFLILIFLFILKGKEFVLFFKKYLITILFAFLIFGILTMPYIKKTKKVMEEVGKRSWKEVSTMLPQYKSYLYLGKENLIYGKLNSSKFFEDIPVKNEHRLSFGYLTFIIFLISLISLRKNFLIFLNFLAFFSLIILTFYIPFDFSFWKIVYEFLPGASALRAVTRCNLILLFP